MKKNKVQKYKNFIFNIYINKICYFQGEDIIGSIHLKSEIDFKHKTLKEPLAIAKLIEYSFYSFEQAYDVQDRTEYRTVEEKEENIIFNLKLDFSQYKGADLLQGVEIPFSLKIEKCHPTCYFSIKKYVKHILSFEFPSLRKEKEEEIIIKNSPLFTIENGLYKSPAVISLEKRKWLLIISRGKFVATLKLPKNSFAYDEKIPYELEIDCKDLDIKIENVKIDLIKKEYLNNRHSYKEVDMYREKIPIKNYGLVKGETNYLIKDFFYFPDYINPLKIYNKLDKREKKSLFSEKEFLYPSCSGGLLSVEYILKIKLKFDLFLSNDEIMLMPIDFYAPYNKNEVNAHKKRNIANNININHNFNSNQQNKQENILDNKRNNNMKNNINNYCITNNYNSNANNNKNQIITNYNNKNAILNANNIYKDNERINQPINNINNLNFQKQNFPQNTDNKMPNNMIFHQPVNNIYNNNYKNIQPINDVYNSNYNKIQPINMMYSNNYKNNIQPINNVYNNNYKNINAQQNINNIYPDNIRINK